MTSPSNASLMRHEFDAYAALSVSNFRGIRSAPAPVLSAAQQAGVTRVNDFHSSTRFGNPDTIAFCAKFVAENSL